MEARREGREPRRLVEYHQDQADRLRRNLAALVAHHEAQAEKLQAKRPKGDAA